MTIVQLFAATTTATRAAIGRATVMNLRCRTSCRWAVHKAMERLDQEAIQNSSLRSKSPRVTAAGAEDGTAAGTAAATMEASFGC